MDDLIARKVRSYTVEPAGGSDDPADIVVVRPGADFSAGFALARAIVEKNGSVRLIAHGVTIRSAWPSWASGLRGLVLTELGAYAAASSLQMTAAIRRSLRDWVERVYVGVTDTHATGEVFYTPVVHRLFQPLLDFHAFYGGILESHPAARIHSVDTWCAADHQAGELRPARRRVRDALLRPTLAAAWVAGMAGTIVACVRARRDAAESLAEIARRQRERSSAPAEWITVVPDWYRMNKHLVDSAALPRVEQGETVGVLLVTTLRSGLRDEMNMKRVRKVDQLWPGLGPLAEKLDHCVVEQAVMPAKPLGLARTLARTIARSSRVAARCVLHPGPLRVLARQEGEFVVARRAMTAATMDVARTLLAEEAAREVTKRHRLDGRLVTFAAANGAGATVVDRVLRDAGATTVELFHGSGGFYWHGGLESHVSVRFVWTEPEARSLAGYMRCLVAGMPNPVAKPRDNRGCRKILLLTNYLHRDWSYVPTCPAEPFMAELIAIGALVRSTVDPAIEVRWRPHPAEDPEAVARCAALDPQVEVSRDRTLDEDLDWCDVAIAGASTALVEAVVKDVPVFAHVMPEFDGVLTSWVPPDRVFFYARDFVEPFRQWHDAVLRGDPTAREPDDRARRALFGPEGRPASFRDGVDRLMSGSPAQGRNSDQVART